MQKEFFTTGVVWVTILETFLVGLKNYFPGEEYILFSMDYQDERALRFEQMNPEFSIIKPSGLFSKLFPSLWRTNLSKEFDDQKLDIFHGLSHELPKKEKIKRPKWLLLFMISFLSDILGISLLLIEKFI